MALLAGDGRLWLTLLLGAVGGACAAAAWSAAGASPRRAERHLPVPLPDAPRPRPTLTPTHDVRRSPPTNSLDPAPRLPPATEPPLPPPARPESAAADTMPTEAPLAATTAAEDRDREPTAANLWAATIRLPPAPADVATTDAPAPSPPALSPAHERLRGLAARQRAGTAELRRSIRDAIERLDPDDRDGLPTREAARRRP
jgi:hypothetical protein